MTAEEAMLAFMAQPGYQPMRLEDLASAIGANKDDLRHLRKLIPALIKSGAVAVRKRDLLMLPEGQALPEGTILFRASGSARVVFTAEPGQKPRDQVHVEARDTGVALHGDRVVVKLNPVRRDRQGDDWGTAAVVRVVKRALTQLTLSLIHI
jgi:ribonuclease R